MTYRLNQIYFDADDMSNEFGIVISFREAGRGDLSNPPNDPTRIRHAVAMRDHEPEDIIKGLRALADWMVVKFSMINMMSEDSPLRKNNPHAV